MFTGFLRIPADIATCMYYTGIDPFTGEEVHVAKHLRDRKPQRALLQFFKPENDFEVRETLLKAGRKDLIGSGCDALIPAHPPQAALRARMKQANRDLDQGRFVHHIEGGQPRQARRASDSQSRERQGPTNAAAGYRPGRISKQIYMEY